MLSFSLVTWWILAGLSSWAWSPRQAKKMQKFLISFLMDLTLDSRIAQFDFNAKNDIHFQRDIAPSIDVRALSVQTNLRHSLCGWLIDWLISCESPPTSWTSFIKNSGEIREECRRDRIKVGQDIKGDNPRCPSPVHPLPITMSGVRIRVITFFMCVYIFSASTLKGLLVKIHLCREGNKGRAEVIITPHPTPCRSSAENIVSRQGAAFKALIYIPT